MRTLIVPTCLACAALARAEVTLPPVLSDHMVLKRGESTAIWGKATPGEKVSVTLADRQAFAQADGDGRWRTALDLRGVSDGPHEMVVKGDTEIRVQDILVGEVWVASGQSNMQFLLRGALGADKELAALRNSGLRHFKVAVNPSLEPLEDCAGTWEVAGPETIGNFTAVGYFFALALQKELNVPVGLLNASLGGTAAESWISPEGLLKNPELAPVAKAQWKAAREYPALKAAWIADFETWTKTYGRSDSRRGDPAAYAAVDADLTGWTTTRIPGSVSKGAPGARWFRKTVEIPPAGAGRPLFLLLGEIDGFEEIYWNGERIGHLTPETHPGASHPRRYDVEPRRVKAGKNVLAIRVYSPFNPAGLAGRVLKAGQRALTGEWETKAEYELPLDNVPPPPLQPPGLRREAGIAASLFNGMIHPLLPFSISGVIWYQGEGNASRASQYRTTFPDLIKDWRERWGRADLPFYFCQLAGHGKKLAEPEAGNWAELREAQASALSLPHTGQAVLWDLGESANVHPSNKKDAGERLARIALAKTYGKDVPFSGPVFQEASVESGTLRVRFAGAAGGLVARPLPETYPVSLSENRTAPLVRYSPDSTLEGFAVCGADGQWFWADARIEGDDVVVWSKQVPEPRFVRFAWADNPTANLYDGAGLPAAPFRTDDQPLSTRKRKYQP